MITPYVENEVALAALPRYRHVSTGNATLEVSLQRGDHRVIERHSEEWRQLCDRARPEMAFLRPELVRAYLNAFAAGDRVVLVMAHREGELVALLPLHERVVGAGTVGLKLLRSAGNVYFQRFDALYADVDPNVVAREFLRVISDAYPSCPLHVELAISGGIVDQMCELAAVRGRITRRHGMGEAPYIEMQNPSACMEEIIAAQGKSLRGSLKRGLRRLGERGDLRVVHVQGSAEGKCLSDWLELFCALEHQGWKGENRTSIYSDPAARQFFRALVRDQNLLPNLRCVALMLDDVMIAADVGLFSNGTYFGMKLAINENFRDCSPGHLMTLILLTELTRLGGTQLDLGGVAEPYKMFWTKTTRPFSSVLIFPPGIRGRLLDAMVFSIGLQTKHYFRSFRFAHCAARTVRRLRSGRQDAPLAVGGGMLV